MEKSSPIIGCRDLWKSFHRQIATSARLQDAILRRRQRQAWTVDALQNVSLDLTKGEWIGITGHNGCGKTTLLRILGGLLKHDRGTVTSNGSISCFFGLGAGFHPDLTLNENVYLHSLLHGLSAKEARCARDAIIDEAELKTHATIPLKCLSLGMLVRLGFASAMAIESDIYLLDEIIAVGDEAFQKHSMKRLCALKAKGKTAIIVSHNPYALHELCDRTLTMESGRIVEAQV